MPLRTALQPLPRRRVPPRRQPGVRGGVGARSWRCCGASTGRRPSRSWGGTRRSSAPRWPTPPPRRSWRSGSRPPSRRETRLSCAVGIGDNLLRAKIATEFGKPGGRFTLTAENWAEVMGHRPTRALWGIGAKTAAKLAERGPAPPWPSWAPPTRRRSPPSSAPRWAPGTCSSGAGSAGSRCAASRGSPARTGGRRPSRPTSPTGRTCRPPPRRSPAASPTTCGPRAGPPRAWA